MGEPIVIDDEFYEFIVKAYRIDPETGRRVKRRAFLSRAKGRAKSELAGMLACAEGIFPVRFAGWDADGEPVARPVRSPYIRCLATEEGQSGNTYDNVSTMMQHVSEHFGDEYPGINFGKSSQTSTRILLARQAGEIVPSTASGSSKDGGKETFAVFDETHLYVLPELKRMHKTVGRNLGKRKEADPWSLETSTMYRPGEESVAELTHNYAQKIAEGSVRETGLLFDHRQAPLNTDLTDRESLLAGLKAAYGPASEWMDLDRIISDIWDPQNDPSDSRRYWLNQVTAASDAWLRPDQWDECADATKALHDGDVVTLGFDGSIREDSTALVACRVEDGHLELLALEEQPDGPEAVGWQVDREAIDGAVHQAFERFTVAGMYADPAHWQDYLDRWTSEFGRRARVRATQARPFEWSMTRSRAVVEALARFREAVISQHLSHTGDTRFRRHALNAKRRESRVGTQIHKEFPSSPRKIDAIVAATLAYEARQDAIALGIGRRSAGTRRIVGF
ncbi:Terminase [Actinomycetospora sp. CA-053990]|uniref:Terminase n=1 Tax=Actinomycetospora sp. CA-053990 TaxID=3239891 RepID=UPI003D8C2F89